MARTRYRNEQPTLRAQVCRASEGLRAEPHFPSKQVMNDQACLGCAPYLGDHGWSTIACTVELIEISIEKGRRLPQPAEEMRGERWDARPAAWSQAFYPFVTACRASKPGPIPYL
jgi:hypothetical protein